jgi:hypothetical protein
MSFKRRMPPQQPTLPTQPSPPELMDMIDEISGVQSVTVTGPDGRRRRITQRLPLTPQEQQTLNQAETLINQAVTNISTLYRYDPTAVANYQPFIQAFSDINNERMQDLAQIGNFKDIAEKVEQFKNISRDLSMREFDNKQRMSEENLARRGLQRSTQASEERAAMARERGLLEQQLEANATNYGEDLTARQLQREENLFSLREQGRQGRLQQAGTGYELERQRLADIESTRQNAINENMNMLDVGRVASGREERARFGLAGNQTALNMFNSQAANQNQRFGNEIARIQGQYNMDSDRFSRTPASFGRQLADVGIALGGRAAGMAIGNAMGNISSFGRVGRDQNV